MRINIDRWHDYTVAAAYMVTQWFEDERRSPSDPLNEPLAEQIVLYRDRAATAGNRYTTDYQQLTAVIEACNEALQVRANCFDVQQNLDESSDLSQLDLELAQAVAKHHTDRIGELAADLNTELIKRLEAAPEVLATAKAYGEPSGLLGNYEVRDLAMGLMQFGITFEDRGPLTPLSRSSIGPEL